MADRGFDGASFRADVRAAKLHYVIRVRGNLQAFRDGKKCTTHKLACSPGNGTIRRDGVALTAKKDAVCGFASCWDEKTKGTWLLITDLPDCGDEIVALYKLHFQIEESIRDIKNSDWAWVWKKFELAILAAGRLCWR
ncbi:MAG: transposase [Myxococcales bacterium]|nr:transposase [Myxococcales bacterium]